VGREQEIAAVSALLSRESVRLVTLTGPGGTGKTRLALQLGAELADRFSHGVFFVALSALREPALVPSAISQALQVQETSGDSLVESLKRHLHDKHLLLLLDNFEQILPAGSLLAELLSACPTVKVLVTSRAALRVRGESEFLVPPLAVPDPRRLPPLEHLEEYDAIRLFAERARDVRPGFALVDQNARAVAEICTHLDGLPLAIELAAARIRVLSPEAMLKRLAQRLQLLTGGARDLPSRQRTLRSTIDWSHDLLEPPEQRLFRHLAVFSGGCTLEAAEAVTLALPKSSDSPDLDPLDGLSSLVEKNLLRQDGHEAAEPRFWMLETIHEYALERLDQGGEADTLRGSHADYYLGLAEEAAPLLEGPEQGEWLDRLDREHDNFRAALRWYSTAHDGAEKGLRVAAALRAFWWARGHVTEGMAWLERALAPDDSVREAVRLRALAGGGTLAFYGGDFERARACHENALAISRRLQDHAAIGTSLSWLANIAGSGGENDRARALLREALSAAREADDAGLTAAVLNNLGEDERLRGDYERAKALYEESLAIYRRMGHWARVNLSLNNLGHVALARGDRRSAVGFYKKNLKLSVRFGMKEGIAAGLEGLAASFGKEGDPALAVRLLGAAEALREAIGHPLEYADRAPYERCVAGVRHALAPEEFSRSWSAGRAMPLEEAIACALPDWEPNTQLTAEEIVDSNERD
jgi:predicted ATPase/Tfp pilus assembly protein PilF